MWQNFSQKAIRLQNPPKKFSLNSIIGLMHIRFHNHESSLTMLSFNSVNYLLSEHRFFPNPFIRNASQLERRNQLGENRLHPSRQQFWDHLVIEITKANWAKLIKINAILRLLDQTNERLVQGSHKYAMLEKFLHKLEYLFAHYISIFPIKTSWHSI